MLPKLVANCRGGEPAWLAYQDGDGAWTRVLPTASGELTTFHLACTSSRGAVSRVAQFTGGLTRCSGLRRIGGTLAWYYYAMPYDGDVRRVATDAGSFTP